MNNFSKVLISAASLVIISISAQAELGPTTKLVPVQVQNLNFDSNSMMVKASGMMPNLCTAAPRPELKKTPNPKVLQLVIEGEQVGDVCMDVAMIGNTYEIAFDVRSLKFNIQDLHLNTENTYTILGRDGKVLVEMDFGKISFEQPFASHQMVNGVFAVMNDGRILVTAENGASFEVRSPIINVNKYVGHPVDISGFVVDAHNKELGFDGSQTSRPLFLLTGLNTTTH